jgi:iron uptake system EfeUOB component EfeO/EfeM
MEGTEGSGIRRRGVYTVLSAVCAAVAVFLIVSATEGQGSTSTKSPALEQRYAVLSLESPHVQSGYTTYSVAPGREAPRPPSFAPLLSAGSFARPVAEYRRYAATQLGLMEPEIASLRSALAAGDTAAAKTAWSAAYTRYLHLGGVYLAGQVSELNEQIDGNPGGLPGGVHSPHFAGLHRIEYGLWTGAPPQSLVSVADRMSVAVQKMRALLPHVAITPLEYGTRAHEILEDAVRDLLSGTDVPLSGEGVTATAAGVAATEEVVDTLHLLLFGEEEGEPRVGQAVEVELATLRSAFAKIAAAHGGHLPTNAQLTHDQAELLDGALGGALEALAQVPEALEAEPPPKPLKIPKADERIDP